MNEIYNCVKAYCNLLDIRYYLVLGRKGKTNSLTVTFEKEDCFHLMGLQYLTDRPELKRNRATIFDEILNCKISTEKLKTSVFYKDIEERIYFLPKLEELFDNNDTVFKYNRTVNSYSMINADYFCRSFFPEGNRDYTKNQASWTLLHKRKYRTSTDKTIFLYDRKGLS